MTHRVQRYVVALTTAAILMSAAPLVTADSLVRLGQPGPWPGVSQLISYRGRIWFVNSEPYVNTNAADVYSYHPGDGDLRYERSLFSQDIGSPVVYDELLYLPFEDARRSAGVGEFAVTDGTKWRWDSLSDGQAFHLHAMGVCFDRLFAVTGAWTGQLQRFDPDGGTWTKLADLDPDKAHFARLTGIRQFKERCFLTASAKRDPGAKIYEWTGNALQRIDAWPSGDSSDAMIAFGRELLAWTDRDQSRIVTAYDGRSTRRIRLPKGERARGWTVRRDRLLVITQNDRGGALWDTPDTREWRKLQTFDHTPISIVSHAGEAYIGTYHRQGGALWGPEPDHGRQSPSPSGPAGDALPSRAIRGEVSIAALAAFRKHLLASLTQAEPTFNGNNGLRRTLARPPMLHSQELGEMLLESSRLALSNEPVAVFGKREIIHRELAQWYLQTTMAMNGYGAIDSRIIDKVWRTPAHASEKYFDPTIAAIVAAGWLKQSDPVTVAGLIARLRNKQDPPWLRADVVGALSAITGERHAYDINAWLSWWRTRNDRNTVD